MRYTISEIEKLYPNWFDPTANLSYDDQKWIWENLPLSEKDNTEPRELRANGSVSVNGNVNGGCKSGVKSKLNWHKSRLILELKSCTSSTPPNKIAFLLEKIFEHWSSKDGHWLWVAQTYTTRTINWVMATTVREYLRGGIRKTPPAYFTYSLRFRKKRRQLRGINGVRKYDDKKE